jgi:hypothetical protein
MSSNDDCVCGEPLATCPHLGQFPTFEAKYAFYAARVPELRAALLELDTLATRADVKRAVEIARIGAEQASKLPTGAEIASALAFILAALAKAASLAGLD